MIDWVETEGLRHFGFSDAQIAQIDASIPKFKYIWDLANNNRTVAAELFGVLGMIFTQLAEFHKENP